MRMLAIFSALIVCAAALSEEQPVDPMEWSPAAECPAFREVLNAEDYAKRLKDELPKLAKIRAERSKLPPRCLKIIAVNGDSPAKRLNLEVGDFVLKIDDKETVNAKAFNGLRTKEPQKLTVLSLKRGTLTVDIQPGLLGTRFINFIRDDPSEIGEGYNDARWRADLDIANFNFVEGDPDLVETAFFHSVAAGMPMTARMKALGAALAQKIGRYDEAMNFAWHALKESPDDSSAQSNFYCAAVCSYKLKAALEIARKADFLRQNVEELERFTAAHDEQPAERRLRLPPSVEAKKWFWDDLLLRSEPIPTMKDDGRYREAFASDMLVIGSHHAEMPSGTYHHFQLKPAVENLMFSCRFKVSQTTPEFSPWLKCFSVGVVPLDPAGAPKFDTIADVIGVSATPYEMPSLRVRRTDTASMNINIERPNFFTNRAHSFELYILDGQVEMNLDGKRLFYGPQSIRGEKFILSVGMVGTTVEMTQYRAWELMSQAERKARVDPAINEQRRDKQTRLYRAVTVSMLEDVKELLDLGADINIPNSQNVTPVHNAIRCGRKDVAEFLASRGAKLDVYSAAGLGDMNALRKLIASGAKPNCPWTPLHCAVQMGQLEAAQLLLEKGADVNAGAGDALGNRTPLMWAAIFDQRKMIEFLLAHGASVNQTDSGGRTALWWAETNRHSEAAALLKDRGGNANATSGPVKPPPPPDADF